MSSDQCVFGPFRTYGRGTFWPGFDEDSPLQTEKLELHRDHQILQSTKHDTCREDGNGQKQAQQLSPDLRRPLGSLTHLHSVWKSSQTAAHVRQQHVSILHLIALAAPRRHVALQHGEPWNTSPWSTLHAILSDVLANQEGENMMVEELKTFFTNFGLAALLLIIPFPFQCFLFTFFVFGDLEWSCGNRS